MARRRLYSRNDGGDPEQGWLVEVSAGDAALGSDPELGADAQELCGIGWMALCDVADDVQISLVIAALDSSGP